MLFVSIRRVAYYASSEDISKAQELMYEDFRMGVTSPTTALAQKIYDVGDTSMWELTSDNLA